MSKQNLKPLIRDAEIELMEQNWRSYGEILNSLFCFTATQLEVADHCRRRACRNAQQCFAKHPLGRDCGANVPSNFLDIMADNFAVQMSLFDFMQERPFDGAPNGLLELIAFAYEKKIYPLGENDKPQKHKLHPKDQRGLSSRDLTYKHNRV